MLVILNFGLDDFKKWFDLFCYEWLREFQLLFKLFDGEFEVYFVSKEVGKVGNNFLLFVIFVNSKENKLNIVNFFVNVLKQLGGKGVFFLKM